MTLNNFHIPFIELTHVYCFSWMNDMNHCHAIINSKRLIIKRYVNYRIEKIYLYIYIYVYSHHHYQHHQHRQHRHHHRHHHHCHLYIHTFIVTLKTCRWSNCTSYKR